MAEQHGVDLQRTELETLLAQVATDEARAELADRDREVDALHLRADRAGDGEIALVRAEHLDLVAADVEWREKWDGVDVVPVRVRNEDPRRQALRTAAHDRVGEPLDARAAHHFRLRLVADLDADA